jgi:hypothetical protein
MPIILRFSRYTKQAYTFFVCLERSLLNTDVKGFDILKVKTCLPALLKAFKKCINKLLFLSGAVKQLQGVQSTTLLFPNDWLSISSCIPLLNTFGNNSSFLLMRFRGCISFLFIIQSPILTLVHHSRRSVSNLVQSGSNSDLPYKNIIR